MRIDSPWRADVARPPVAYAWLLNLGSELELGRQDARGPGWGPSRATARLAARWAAALSGLVGPDDLVVPLRGGSPDCGGRPGRAFCPTPFALRRLAEARAVPPRGPAFEVLRRTSSRAFSAALGQTLPGAAYVRDRDALAVCLRGASGSWVLKPAFSFAGRGQRRVDPSRLGAADETWLARALSAGDGLQVEPWVERLVDLGLHGYIEPGGALELGEITVQRCTPGGGWLSSARARPGDLLPGEGAALVAEARLVAGALLEAGYFGPFGVDAFRYRRPADGQVQLRARSEINARYSMGWAIGMGPFAPPAGLP